MHRNAPRGQILNFQNTSVKACDEIMLEIQIKKMSLEVKSLQDQMGDTFEAGTSYTSGSTSTLADPIPNPVVVISAW